MTRAISWLVGMLAGALEPAEREAVLGDLAETNERSTQVLRDLAGLVARRQLALWKHWQPWLLLFVIVIPFGLMLGFRSRTAFNLSIVSIWRYVGGADSLLTDLGDHEFFKNFANIILRLLLSWFSVACAAWGAGFGIGTLARSTRVITVSIGFLALCLVGVVPATDPYSMVVSRLHLSLAVPAFFLICFALMPVYYGARHAGRRTPPSTRAQALLLAYCLAQAVVWPTVLLPLMARHSVPQAFNWTFAVSRCINYWPIAYWIALKWSAFRQNTVSYS
jgi:hypothetical protein